MDRDFPFPLIKLAKKLKAIKGSINLEQLTFPLIKLAKKLKASPQRATVVQLGWHYQFPLIKLAKKLKDLIGFLQKEETRRFPLIKLAKKLKEGHCPPWEQRKAQGFH